MPSGKSVIDAFDYAKIFVKKMPLETVQLQILDDTNKYLWMAAPWRWTLGSLTNVPLAASTQDYTLTLPNDYLYPLYAYAYDVNATVPRILTVEPFLVLGGIVGQPSSIAVTGAAGGSGTVRISPIPGTGNITATDIIYTIYKKFAPVFTPANIYTPGTQVFDDEWFHVYESGVLYYAYLYADDERAGAAQIDPGSGKVTFSGQRGVFEANIELMKQREKLPTFYTNPEAQKVVI